MLAQRIITAVILLAIIVGALWAGTVAFAGLAAVAMGAAAYEWLHLAGHQPLAGTLGAVGLAAALFAADFYGVVDADDVLHLAALAIGIWLALVVVLVQAQRNSVRIPRLASTVLCIVLLCAAWMSALQLVRLGVTQLVSALAIVWIADTAAYFAGRAWGRRKLAAKISPGKTWAGVVGAIVVVLALALAAAFLWPEIPLFSTLLLQRLSPPVALLLLAGLVALSIVGDLFESLLKRQAGAKDSSRLLPGHGGVLDRIDALLPLLPAAFLLTSTWRP